MLSMTDLLFSAIVEIIIRYKNSWAPTRPIFIEIICHFDFMTVETLAENTWKDRCREDRRIPRVNWSGVFAWPEWPVSTVSIASSCQNSHDYFHRVCLFSYRVPIWLHHQVNILLEDLNERCQYRYLWSPKHEAWWYFCFGANITSKLPTSYSFWLYYFPLVVNWQKSLKRNTCCTDKWVFLELNI